MVLHRAKTYVATACFSSLHGLYNDSARRSAKLMTPSSSGEPFFDAMRRDSREAVEIGEWDAAINPFHSAN